MPQSQLQQALRAAERLGAAHAEAVMSKNTSLSIEVCRGEVETLSLSESAGLGVRVFSPDHRMGFAYATDLSGGPERVVEMAWQNALANDPDEFNVLLDEAIESEDDWAEEDFDAVPLESKIQFAKDLEAKTLDADPLLTFVESAGYSDSRSEFSLCNSRGLNRRFRSASCSCSAGGIASRGDDSDSEIGSEFDFGRTYDALRQDWVAEQCAKKAVEKLGGKPCATAKMPVVFDRYVTTQFLQILGPALKADNVLKGKSLFAGKRGESIASEAFSLVDQNDLPEGFYRSPFDGEGASSQRTALIEGGVLTNYMHNAYTAKKMGEKTTANASRGGFRATPGIGAANSHLLPGTITPEELLAKAGKGLLITDAMGIHTANTISGDFSFGVNGLLIENGELTCPVRGVTVAGNIKDLLKDIVVAGNDLRFFGAYGAPSVLVSELMISGA